MLACTGTLSAGGALEALGVRLTAQGREKLQAAGTPFSQLRPDGHELALVFLKPLAKGPQTADGAAAPLLNNRVGLLGYPSEAMGEPFDWFRAPKQDLQWPTHLSRHYYLMPLARSYAATGEEKYAAHMVHILINWVNTFPLGAKGLKWSWKTAPGTPGETSGQGLMPDYVDGPWTSLSAEARTHSWLSLLPLVAGSQSMTNEVTATLLNCLLGPHRRLMLDFPRSGTANQFVALGAALIKMGAELPDFTGAEECRRVGLERMTQFAKASVYEDGSVAECSPNYGIGSVGRLSDMAVEPARVRAALRYYTFIMDPLGRSPRIAKGGGKVIPQLKKLNDTVKDPEVAWVLSQGAEGMAPAHQNYGYNWAGHFVMRSGWKPEDAWLFFDAGPRGAGHHDRAQLGIQLVAGGAPLLVDPGYYTYSTSGKEGDMARYLNSTAAHNAGMVDGEGQISFAPGKGAASNTSAGVYGWSDGPQVVRAKGSYTLGYGEKGRIPVVHKRQVAFTRATGEFTVDDAFSGEGAHTYEVLWQAPPNAKVEIAQRRVTIRAAQVTAVLEFASEAELRITQAGGWYSEHYGQLEPATTIRVAFDGQGSLKTTIRTTRER